MVNSDAEVPRQDLIIVGAGGFGRELLEMLWEVFLAARVSLQGLSWRAKESDVRRYGVDAEVLADPEIYRARSAGSIPAGHRRHGCAAADGGIDPIARRHVPEFRPSQGPRGLDRAAGCGSASSIRLRWCPTGPDWRTSCT